MEYIQKFSGLGTSRKIRIKAFWSRYHHSLSKFKRETVLLEGCLPRLPSVVENIEEDKSALYSDLIFLKKICSLFSQETAYLIKLFRFSHYALSNWISYTESLV